MKKTLFGLFLATLLAIVLVGCYQGEIGVETRFYGNGSGERVFILDVMDDLLSNEPIPNPDDPDGSKDFGPVLNDQHIEGGIIAIQEWLSENKPKILTLHEPEIDGYHRYFKLSFTFDSWEDFLAKYKILVDLSPSVKWDDFEDFELPQWQVEGKKVTFTESREILMASMDWAITGIHADLYDPKDLGDVGPNDIVTLANYRLFMGSGELLLEQRYDPEYVNPNTGNEGAVVYPSETEFMLEYTFKDDEMQAPGEELPNKEDPTNGENKGLSTGAIVAIVIGSVAVAGAIGYAVFHFIKRRP